MKNLTFGASHFFYKPLLTPALQARLNQTIDSDPEHRTNTRNVGDVQIVDTDSTGLRNIDFDLQRLAQKMHLYALGWEESASENTYRNDLPAVFYKREWDHLPLFNDAPNTINTLESNLDQMKTKYFIEGLIPESLEKRLQAGELPGKLGEIVPSDVALDVMRFDSKSVSSLPQVAVSARPGCHYQVTSMHLDRREENQFAHHLQDKAVTTDWTSVVPYWRQLVRGDRFDFSS